MQQFNNYLIAALIATVYFFGPNISFAQTQTDLAEIHKQIELDNSTTVIIEYGSNSLLPSSSKPEQIDDLTLKSSTVLEREKFLSSLSKETQSKTVHNYQFVSASVLNVDAVALEELKLNPNVKNIYLNRRLKPYLAESVDLVFGAQDVSEYDGAGWSVAILDTGVDKGHGFLQDKGKLKVVSEGCFSGGSYGSEFREVKRFCPGNQLVSTASGSGVQCSGFQGCDHGTHVAGIAAGSGNTFNGVAKGANIISLQVFTGIRDVFQRNVCGTGVGDSCISAFSSDIIKALERVYALRNSLKIASVNMSLGGGRFSSSCQNSNRPMTNIIARLKSAGIATVVASGNDGYSSGIGFPACIPDAIAVGATSDVTTSDFTKDQRASYSNLSNQLDIYAPGTLIQSSVPGNRFSNFNGTSMATPHVAGAFAVLKQGAPNKTVAQLEAILKSVGPTVTSSSITRRRLDVNNALRSLGLLSTNLTPIFSLLLDEDEVTD